MKNFLVLCMVLMGTNFGLLHAQESEKVDPDPGIGISFKVLFMDYQTANGGNFSNFKDYHSGFEIALHKEITDQVNVVIPFKIGVVNAEPISEGSDYLRRSVYGLDAQLHYHVAVEGAFQPYLLAGVGGVLEKEGEFNVQIPLGIGFKAQIFERAYFNYQAEYRLSLAEDRNNLHHGIGFIYMLGPDSPNDKPKMKKIDSDGDGVSDDMDLCPQIPGLAENSGCPDSDGDGVPDFQDECPTQPGLKEMMGCPDSDGDGVADHKDECPNLAGTIANNGCPDMKDSDGDGILDSVDECPNIAGTLANKGCPPVADDKDGDGVPDSVDKCPNQAGPAALNGCPDSDGDGVADHLDQCPNSPGPLVYNGCPDTDGDGIHDGRDNCPNQKGTVALNGCPEIAQADKETLDIAMRAVQFDTGKATLKSESYDVLAQIASILNRYPDYSLSIEGHTDNTGSASNNQVLSEKRAKSCYTYLLNRGVSASRLSYAGYGESRPVSDNNSLRGRTLNRRVEFKMVPTGR